MTMQKRLRVLMIIVVLVFVVAFALWFGLRERAPEASVAPSQAVLGTFQARVLNKLSGQPIAGATVRVSAAGYVANLVADREGRVKLEAQAGVYTLAAVADGFVGLGKEDHGRTVAIVDDTHFVNGAIFLLPAASVRGRVLARMSPKSASVVMEYHEDASGGKDYVFGTYRSDERGEFVISDAFEGTGMIKIVAEGFAPIVLNNVQIAAGQSVDLGDIPLLEGCSVYGRVISAVNNVPISMAQLALFDDNDVILASTQTDSAGNYRFEPVTVKAAHLRVRADAFGMVETAMQFGQSVDFMQNISMQATSGLVLNVFNLTQRGEAQSDIVVRDLASQVVVYENRVPNGKLQLKDVHGGPFLIEASSPDMLTRSTLRATMGSEIDVILKAWSTLSVSVHNSQGVVAAGEYQYSFTPVNSTMGASATQSAWQGFTGPGFEMKDLQEGDYVVTVRDAQMDVAQSSVLRIRLGEKRLLSLNIQTPGTLRGRVLSSDGQPVHCKVERIGDAQVLYTDADGYFTMGPIHSESISLVVTMLNNKSQRFDGIALRGGETSEREFRLYASFEAANATSSPGDAIPAGTYEDFGPGSNFEPPPGFGPPPDFVPGADYEPPPDFDTIIEPRPYMPDENWGPPIPESDDAMEFNL